MKGEKRKIAVEQDISAERDENERWISADVLATMAYFEQTFGIRPDVLEGLQLRRMVEDSHRENKNTPVKKHGSPAIDIIDRFLKECWGFESGVAAIRFSGKTPEQKKKLKEYFRELVEARRDSLREP